MSDRLFWEVAEPLLASGAIVEGELMRSRCVRTPAGEFVAMADRNDGDLVAKLPSPRVDELIAAGEGHPFAPAGRVFREWVRIDAHDEARWRELLQEAIAFAEAAS